MALKRRKLTKRIDGKTYEPATTILTKREAQARADKFRREGKLARVIAEPHGVGGYRVWVAKK